MYIMRFLKRYIWRLFVPLVILCVFTIVLLVHVPNHHPYDLSAKIYYYLNPAKSIGCYRYNENYETLPEITSMKIRPNKSIFFHETSCKSNWIALDPRQACAVESAARMNPNLDVYVTFSSPGTLRSSFGENDRVTEALQVYKNIKLVHLNFGKFTSGTPLESVYSSGKLEYSSYAVSHSSDILRYLTLYKYGGIYLDLDVVVMKSLEELEMNYAGAETIYNVAAGILSLDAHGEGHEYAAKCIEDLRLNYRSHEWGNNGPGVITRLLRTLCRVEMSKDMVNRTCEQFRVYPQKMFYPIEWRDWKMYFTDENFENVMKMFNETYAIHVWNKHSASKKVAVNVRTPYNAIASKYCPNVFQQCKEYF